MGRETLVPQSFQMRLANALLGFSAYCQSCGSQGLCNSGCGSGLLNSQASVFILFIENIYIEKKNIIHNRQQ